jgi:histidinol-phosphate aminotransferase
MSRVTMTEEAALAVVARAAVRRLEPYTWEPASRALAKRFGLGERDIVRFDTNTSPLPPSSLAAVLQRSIAAPDVNEYFDSAYTDLAAALSAYAGCAPGNLVIGAGADEILLLLALTFLDPGDKVVVPVPTYSMYRIVAETMGAEVQAVPPEEGLHLNPRAIAEAAQGARLVFLCNPNNPTGLRLPLDALDRLATEIRCPLVVDEAYAEFSGESALSLVARHPRLIVVRTLSKAFSLAGARIGYAVSAPEVAALVQRVRPPQSVSSISVHLAEAALADRKAMLANVAALAGERDRLAAGLRRLGLKPVPSHTNFVLVPLASPAQATGVYEACLRQGMVLRTYANSAHLSHCLRITARRQEEGDRLLRAMAENL